MTTIIDMIRHGTPEGGNRYRGHNIDDPLSEEGWQQMWTAVEDYPVWDAVISSPMQRCLSFAQAYAESHRLDVEIIENLKEVGFGEWEGKSSREILAENPDVIKNFYHDPVTHKPAGAEALDQFQKRIQSAIEYTLEKYIGKQVLLVAHAGVIRAAVTAMIQAAPASMYRISIGNAAIVRIKDDGIRPPTVMIY